MMNEPLSEIMTEELVTLRPDSTLAEVRDIFHTRRIHHIPIVEDDNKLVGLITTYDLFKLEHAPDNYSNIPVSEVMTTGIATLEPEEKVGAAAELFLEHLFHAVPIVKEGKLLGIVTSFDILRYEFKKEYPKHSFADS